MKNEVLISEIKDIVLNMEHIEVRPNGFIYMDFAGLTDSEDEHTEIISTAEISTDIEQVLKIDTNEKFFIEVNEEDNLVATSENNKIVLLSTKVVWKRGRLEIFKK